MTNKLDRRKFFRDTTLSAAGIVLGSNLIGCTSRKEPDMLSYHIMEDVIKYRKIDAHAHVWNSNDVDLRIDDADRLGIEFISISNPIINQKLKGTPDEIKESNDVIFDAMKQHPKRYVGMFTLNPLYQKESIEEIKRRADQGFVGFKGYIMVKVNDPLFYPIIEKLIDLKLHCLMHSECELGIGGYRMKYDRGNRPNATIPEDMVEAAIRYPEATFQMAHIASGDFEYICKYIKNYPNIYVDVAGTHNAEKQVDFAIEHLGEDRVFFASDNSFYQGVGNILSSNTTEALKKKLFFDNYNNILKKGGRNVD